MIYRNRSSSSIPPFLGTSPDDFIEYADKYYKYDIITHQKLQEIIKEDDNHPTLVTVGLVCNTLNRNYTLADGLTLEHIEKINKHNLLAKKKKSKEEAKKLINITYKIGDILLLRGKYKDGSKKNEKVFEVKKVIWSLKGQIINALILKQLSGTNQNMSLTKKDCIKYHVKYEPGLQVYSMNMDFKKRKVILNN